MSNQVTASIVVYKNSPDQVVRASESFRQSSPESTLFVIDNSPTDLMRSYLPNDSQIQYIFNGKNLGFGVAHNIAIKESLARGAAFHLVLNPDVYFDKAVVPTIISLMAGHPEIGLVMPKVLYPDGSLQYLCKLLPSPEHLFLRRFFPFNTRLFRDKNNLYELQFSGYDRLMDVPCLSGCFMLLRNECLQKIGLFDESIFLYAEDIDLSRRIHKYFRTVFYPEVEIYHIHNRRSYRSLLPFYFHIQSAIRYFNKWGWFDDPERDEINRATLLRLTQ